MRATTVRFSEDLWRLLEREAEREGVSAAQFIRDASVMRAAYAMGRRGDAAYEAARARRQRPRQRRGAATALLGADEARRLRPPSAAAGPRRAPRGAARHRRRRPGPRRASQALRATGLLDCAPDPGFDRHVRLAAEVLNAPVALVSLIDENRQFLKSCSASRSRGRAIARRRSRTPSASTPSRSASRSSSTTRASIRCSRHNPAVVGDGHRRLRGRPARSTPAATRSARCA